MDRCGARTTLFPAAAAVVVVVVVAAAAAAAAAVSAAKSHSPLNPSHARLLPPPPRPFFPPPQIDLSKCIALLNAVDAELDQIITRSPSLLLQAPPLAATLSTPWSAESMADLENAKRLVAFTANLLRHSMNKDVYNSAEHLVTLLRALDDELAVLALQVVVPRATPYHAPPYHAPA